MTKTNPQRDPLMSPTPADGVGRARVNPFLVVTFLYLAAAILAAADSALTNFTVIPWFNGLRWLRIHLITLGAVTQFAFGILPRLVAGVNRRPQPKTRLDIWVVLNAGILTLIAGIPVVNTSLIFVGGTLVFAATVMLIGQLRRLCDHGSAKGRPAGTRFYVVGLLYFLVGILVGTGLWLGWSEALAIAVPVEVHIHANNWGLLSLVFAGLLVDFYPRFTGRELAWPSSISPIFWMMTLGALGLILGPWVGSTFFSVPGIILHLSATVWLLLNVIRPVRGDAALWREPGMWHMVTAYVWIVAPVLVAPLIIAGVPGFPGAGIEQNAPQALIYGWVLLYSYAVIPHFVRRVFTPDAPGTLGGNWFSLAAVHLGGVLLWAGIFLEGSREVLHGTAYTLWAASLVPIVVGVGRIVREGLDGPSSRAEAGLDTRPRLEETSIAES